jgi:hypothetical protein
MDWEFQAEVFQWRGPAHGQIDDGDVVRVHLSVGG